MQINTTKKKERKGVENWEPSQSTPLAVDGDELEEVDEFVYLESLVTAENNTSKEIRKRILAGNRAYFGLWKTLRSG